MKDSASASAPLPRRCVTCSHLGARPVVVPLVEIDIARPGTLKRLAALELLLCRTCHPDREETFP